MGRPWAWLLLAVVGSAVPAVVAHAQRDAPQAEGELVLHAEVLSDSEWNDLVVEENGRLVATATLDSQGRLRVDSNVQMPTIAPVQRQSIDRDVLQGLIADRSRQLALRALADA